MEVEDVEGSKQWGSRFKGDLCDCLLELEGLGGPLLFFFNFHWFLVICFWTRKVWWSQVEVGRW